MYIIYTLNKCGLIFKEYYTTSKCIAASLSKSIHNLSFLFLLLLPFTYLYVINIQYIFTTRIVKRWLLRHFTYIILLKDNKIDL